MFTTWSTTQVDALSAIVREHASIILLSILLSCPFLLTYALSSHKFHHAISVAKSNAARQTDEASPTPILPYWIPLLGHTIPFVFSTSRFMAHLSKTYPSLPVKLYVGGRFLQFIPHGDPVSTLHRHPRKLTNVLIPVKFMTDTGLSREDQVRGEIDELSGVLPQPNPGWEHLPDNRRWNYLEHKDFAAHLSGSAQEAVLGKKFAERLIHELLSWASEQQHQPRCPRNANEKASGGRWIVVPDLTKSLREKIFIAAVSALYGPELLEIAPDLPATYWAWLDQMPQMFRRLPRWMIPSAYAARERTLQALMKWDEINRRERPEVLERAKQGIWEWDSLHGSTLTQARTKMFDEFGISKEGAALFHSAMMFALTPNATYATIWSLLDVLRAGPDLIKRVMAESAPFLQSSSPDGGSSPLSPNTTEINRLPLLGSIFMETLRLRAASPVGRTPIDDSFHLYSPSTSSNCELNGRNKLNGPSPQMKWKLEKDVHIISSSWLGGHDATFWNEGRCSPETGKPEHPVDEFWAERFLEYPDDPFSGPVKKTSHNSKNTFQATGTYKKKTPEDDKTARLATQGTSSHWFPFGGGLNTCPGRHFAKKEVTVAVAILLRLFEFEGLDSDKVEVNMDHYPFGTLPPKGKASVRMRLREDFCTI